jgi:hypothetical protein
MRFLLECSLFVTENHIVTVYHLYLFVSENVFPVNTMNTYDVDETQGLLAQSFYHQFLDD